ncbi:MAG TPA: hypothetical protein VHL34_20985, partial [Rhizomicrobium sp.]|nr:hypothetical protein [Rhizomicrobium sp.]
MTNKNESPAEPFKRAVTATVRSLAGEPELEVNFSAEPPQMRGNKARLPLPSRNLPPGEVAVIRGAGDAYALRKAYHEDRLHESLRPQSTEAAAMFEAAEQARVEAIGANAMMGVARNLTANLDARLTAKGFAKVRVKSDAPIADVLGLLIREKLTGEAPPENAKLAVDLWRDWVQERAGKEMEKLPELIRDQKAFAKLTKNILKDLNYGDEFDKGNESEEGGEDNEDSEPQESEDQDSDSDSESAEADLSESEGEEGSEAEAEMRDQRTDDMQEGEEPEEGMKPWRQDLPFSGQEEWGYKVHTTQFDEEIEAEELCD